MTSPSQPASTDVLRTDTLRRRVTSHDTQVGTFVGMRSPIVGEVCAAAGLDWILVDLEHGSGGEEQLAYTVPMAAAYGVPVLARVESSERIRVGRVLDLGVAGVMFPRIDSAREAEVAVRHLRYPPAGDRGVATYNRACRYGLDPQALDRANDAVLGVIQIESRAAVENVAEIAAVDGVDVLFVGPRDLSHDLGVPGNVAAPLFVEAIGHVREAAASRGKVCGLLVGDGIAARARIAEGWTFVAIGSDSSLLASAVQSHAAAARMGREPDAISERTQEAT